MTTKIWTERYQPNNFNDYIWNKENGDLKHNVESFILANEIPLLMLVGSAGTGKTTLVKLLKQHIKGGWLPTINGSDTTGIDFIRDTIKPFLQATSFNNKGLKYVVIEEVDRLSPQAQDMLKDLTLKYIDSSRFILTTNHYDRIVEPLQSRFSMGKYTIKPMDMPSVAEYVANVLVKENITYEIKDIVELIKRTYPDIRKAINLADKFSYKGVFKLSDEILAEINFVDGIINVLSNQSLSKIDALIKMRTIITETIVSDYTIIIHNIFDKIDVITTNAMIQANMIEILTDILLNDKNVYGKSKEINIANGLNQLIMLLKK